MGDGFGGSTSGGAGQDFNDAPAPNGLNTDAAKIETCD
jgi:hypothetical protein